MKYVPVKFLTNPDKSKIFDRKPEKTGSVSDRIRVPVKSAKSFDR
jgi:hypothetical protein